MKIQRVNKFKNKSSGSIIGEIGRYSVLEYVSVENTDTLPLTIRIGTVLGGADIYEGELSSIATTITINAYFTRDRDIYLSWEGKQLPFVAVVWKTLDAEEFNSIPFYPPNGNGVCFRRDRKKPHTIVELFGQVVERVNQCLTQKLQTVDSTITGIHYDHGHPMEIIETLKQKDQSVSQRFSRYPIVALFQDFPEAAGRQIGIQSEVTLHVIIARATKPDYKAHERYDYNFNPILYPVYAELFRQLHWHRAVVSKGPDLIQHTKIDRLYWGRESLWGNKANIFSDWIDCIEIKDLKLKVNLKLC